MIYLVRVNVKLGKEQAIAEINKRILELVSAHAGENKAKFAKAIGVDRSRIDALDRTDKPPKSMPGGDLIAAILSRYPEINPDWLLFGKEPQVRPPTHESDGETRPFSSQTVNHGDGALGGMQCGLAYVWAMAKTRDQRFKVQTRFHAWSEEMYDMLKAEPPEQPKIFGTDPRDGPPSEKTGSQG